MTIRNWIAAGLLGIAVGIVTVAMATAQDPQRMRDEARELMREAERLQDRGLHDRAEALIHEAEELMGAAEQRQDPHRRIDELRREIEELRELGRHDRAEQVERQVQRLIEQVERQQQRRRRGADDGQAVEVRIHHLRQAAEHLDAAGFGEWADEVRGRAEGILAEFNQRNGRREPAGELAGHVKELTGAFRQLRREVQELHEIVGDLRERVDAMADRHE